MLFHYYLHRKIYTLELDLNTGVYIYTEAATRGVLCKKVFLEISQNSQENTCADSGTGVFLWIL